MTDIENIKNVIKNIAKEQKFAPYEVDIKPISSGGANYSSLLYVVTIKEDGNVHHLFAKAGSFGDKMRETYPRIFINETFIYKDLSNIYRNLEDRFKVPDENRLIFTKYYGSNLKTYEEILVLENLVAKGYQSFDRFKSIDWEYATAAVRELTKFHSLSIAFSEYYPEESQKIHDDLKFDWSMDENGQMGQYYKTSSIQALNIVEEEFRDKLKRFFEIYPGEKYAELYAPTRKQVLMHGDFRPSNFMHKVRDDGTVEIKVIDLQTMQEGSPVVDLLYLICVGSDARFRDEYYQKLIDFYYSELAAAMRRFQLDPEKVYSRADFDSEYKKKLPYGLVTAVYMLPIVTVPEENTPDLDQMELASFNLDNKTELFFDRLNGIVRDFDKWGGFDE